MFNITKTDLEAACPAGMRPDHSLAGRLRSFFDSAWLSLAGLCTREILAGVENTCDLDAAAETKEERLCQAALRFIISRGFHDALPHLDLVLTPTGFGVVSNQNVAPASADRVERLRQQMLRQSMDAYEEALSVVREFDEWHSSPMRDAARHLFWHSRFLRKFGETDPTLETLRRYYPRLLRGESVLRRLISDAQFLLLVHEEAHASADDTHAIAIDLCRDFVAVLDNPRDALLQRGILLDFLDSNIDHFAAYRSSTAYEANHAKPYENKKDDPCYFFG